MRFFIITTFTIIQLFFSFIYRPQSIVSASRTTTVVESTTKCTIPWGDTFVTPLLGTNVKLDCNTSTGAAVCCEAMDDRVAIHSSSVSRGVGNAHENFVSNYRHFTKHPEKCEIHKIYHSSPQEIRDFETALELNTISKTTTRLEKLLDYVTSKEYMLNTTKWLDRVTYHMNNHEVSYSDNSQHIDDKEFLSYFEITKKCETSESVTWFEWIEPIMITARHPFAFGFCPPIYAYYRKRGQAKNGELLRRSVGLSHVDYVLLQSGNNLNLHHHDSKGKYQHSHKTTIYRSNKLDYFNSSLHSQHASGVRTIYNKDITPSKFYMLDAGASTFDSSLYWFTCGYSQNKVSFDQVYAWELTLLEPINYWQRVPSKWIPYWHFYDIPVSSNEKSYNSPIRLIKSIATSQDFVAFKLDIDAPDVEMPIALNLLRDLEIQSLVDEFFFELHFRCEVLQACNAWGYEIPNESHGVILDRAHALKYFIELRQLGIRAHIWP